MTNSTQSAVTFKKTRKAAPYQWGGIGSRSCSQAAEYNCLVDGKVIAKISRRYGGGYMEPTLWEARATETKLDYFGQKVDGMIVESGRTLKTVKEKLTNRFGQ